MSLVNVINISVKVSWAYTHSFCQHQQLLAFMQLT